MVLAIGYRFIARSIGILFIYGHIAGQQKIIVIINGGGKLNESKKNLMIIRYHTAWLQILTGGLMYIGAVLKDTFFVEYAFIGGLGLLNVVIVFSYELLKKNKWFKMKRDDYIGNCTACPKKDVEICPDTGWCNDCAKEYYDEEEEYLSALEEDAK